MTLREVAVRLGVSAAALSPRRSLRRRLDATTTREADDGRGGGRLNFNAGAVERLAIELQAARRARAEDRRLRAAGLAPSLPRGRPPVI